MSKPIDDYAPAESVAVGEPAAVDDAGNPARGRREFRPLNRETEAELVRRSRKGDAVAYGRLIDAYQSRIYSLALRILASPEDAEEATQEAFLKAYRNLGRFEEKSLFYTWLYRIASNTALNLLSREKRRGRGRFLDLDEVNDRGEGGLRRELEDGQPNPKERLAEQDLEIAIHREIARLPADLRVVVVLRDIEGMAYEEIAEDLKLPLGTIKSRLHKGRTRLQRALGPLLAG